MSLSRLLAAPSASCLPSGSGEALPGRTAPWIAKGRIRDLPESGHVWRLKTGASSSSRGRDAARSSDHENSLSRFSVSEDSWADPATFLPGHEMGASVGGQEVHLVYIPYMDHIWRKLVEGVPDLRLLPLASELRLKRSRKGSKPARCCNWLLCGERLRRIRFTYFEAGAAGQAFNCLLYPDTRFDLPLLGIDLISLGASKILCVIDFLPLEQDTAYLDRHTGALAPVRNSFVRHCGRMSSRHFDENQFFSKQLIFYRSDRGVEDPILQVPEGELFTVYVGYVEQYLKALYAAVPVEDSQHVEYVKARQDAYDQYNAERDPAIKLFDTYFGPEWSKACTEDFLFPGARLGHSDTPE